MERLQKIIAQAGICSRRAAENLIAEGRVKVDGHLVREMGVKVDPARQEIVVKGRPLELTEKKVYILLHKPVGYVTTLSDPQGRPIVTDLLTGVSARLFPVGRLDFDTSGALLLTNDGGLAQRIQHPSFEIPKTYEAKVKGTPAAKAIQQLEKGVMVDGRLTSPARVVLVKGQGRSSLLKITIHEGRKRQVRKMCAAVGHPVQELCRRAYGRLKLADLAVGHYRVLDSADISRIFAAAPAVKTQKKSKNRRKRVSKRRS
ncbi:MAG: pseudouridine synthase [Thermodesulfobacteriota bacterium]